MCLKAEGLRPKMYRCRGQLINCEREGRLKQRLEHNQAALSSQIAGKVLRSGRSPEVVVVLSETASSSNLESKGVQRTAPGVEALDSAEGTGGTDERKEMR